MVMSALLVEKSRHPESAIVRDPSIGRFRVSRMTSPRSPSVGARLLAVLVGVIIVGGQAAFAGPVSVGPGVLAEVVVTGIPLPLQLALGRAGSLVVLSQGLG